MEYFRGSWPDGCRGAFALTFDCDVSYAYTGTPKTVGIPPTGEELLAKQPRSLANLSRGLYGLHVGLPRILDFLDHHHMKGTFFVPSANIERYPDDFKALRDRGQEIAAHGHQHENLPDYRDDPATEAAILETSIRVMDEILGVRPIGYRSPAWDMNQHSLKILQNAGFVYDSSLFAGEAPYRTTVHDPSTDMLEFPIDWSQDDAPYFLFFKPPITMAQFHDPAEVEAIWQADLDGTINDGGVFTLTCHPSVIGRHHRMKILDNLVAHAKKRGDIWIAPLADIANHVNSVWKKV